MIKRLYSVYDKKAKTTLQVFEMPNDLVAIRDFSQLCVKEDCQVCKFKEDYTLLCLGELDTETGVIKSEVREIAKAEDYAN